MATSVSEGSVHPQQVSPTSEANLATRDVERPLKDSELFFSTTDKKGVITSGNHVFERVSGYALTDLIGRAHNIVRHPDMPRAVFQLLWDTIRADQPVAAYVKNRAADGSYYWVLASVVPVRGGYLSVRLCPGAEYFAMAKAVYAELVELEREIEGDDVKQRKPSIAASVDRLGELLAGAGFKDYYAFMRAALAAEVARRAERLPEGYRMALTAVPEGAAPAVTDIISQCQSMGDFLEHLVSDLARYGQVGRALADQSAYLRAMGDDVRLFALNAQIGASRLGAQGAALDAVARLLTEQSQATSPVVAAVAERAALAVSEIEEMTFQLSLSTIQAETISVFAHEAARESDIDHTAAVNMVSLADALQRGSDRTFASLKAVAHQLSDVLEQVGLVGAAIDRLARLSLNGRVELASVPDAGSIGTLFSDVERQVIEARTRLSEFSLIADAAADLEAAADHDAMHAAARLHERAASLTLG